MAATDGQIILAASRFGDSNPVYLRDFAKQKLPAIAKVIKGQHHNLGVPSLSNPSLQSTAIFLNAGKKYQILAQPIKIKEGRKTTNVGHKVLIPETYPGYFELLSEDGRSVRCIDSTLELSKRRNLRVLVRETFRCNHNSKTVHAGEIITTISDNGKYLQCRTLKDEIINLPMEGKTKFSPFAKEDSISGVHCVKNLLQKRMPVIVRLVHGTAPKGLKTPFVPELRLLGCVEVDRIFALPLQKDTDLIAVPLNAKLKLQCAKNMDQLENFIEFSRFLEKSQRLLAEARDRLQIVDVKLTDKDKKDTSKNILNRKQPTTSSSLASGSENGYALKKSASCDSTKYTQQTNFNTIAAEYDQIDQIYDYVRGFAPLPKNLNRFESLPETPVSQKSTGEISTKPVNDNNAKINSLEQVKKEQLHDTKPLPPPVETIPKKLPEKRQRPSLPKLYVKNSIINTPKLSSSNSQALIINGKDALEPQSPLFHIRYKSLSSLQLNLDSNQLTPQTPVQPNKLTQEKNYKLSKSASAGQGTLDSSISGGRTSGDSTKLPEKKTRHARPRSLSNLIWDLKPHKENTKKKLFIHHNDHRRQETLYL